MKYKIIYPRIEKRRYTFRVRRNMVAFLFLFAFVVCGIINLAVSGIAWSIIVGVSLWLVWRNIVEKNLIENTLTNRITRSVIHVCILLFTINVVYHLSFAPFTITIIFFGLLLVLVGILFTNYKKQKRNLMPLTWLIFITSGIFISSSLGLFPMNWPMIVLGSIAVAFIIVSTIWFRKDILLEWKKRFH